MLKMQQDAYCPDVKPVTMKFTEEIMAKNEAHRRWNLSWNLKMELRSLQIGNVETGLSVDLSVLGLIELGLE